MLPAFQECACLQHGEAVTGVSGKWRASRKAREASVGTSKNRLLLGRGRHPQDKAHCGSVQNFVELEGKVGGKGETGIERDRGSSSWQRSMRARGFEGLCCVSCYRV